MKLVRLLRSRWLKEVFIIGLFKSRFMLPIQRWRPVFSSTETYANRCPIMQRITGHSPLHFSYIKAPVQLLCTANFLIQKLFLPLFLSPQLSGSVLSHPLLQLYFFLPTWCFISVLGHCMNEASQKLLPFWPKFRLVKSTLLSQDEGGYEVNKYNMKINKNPLASSK